MAIVRRCELKDCKRYFGTVAGYLEHHGERGCKSDKSLTRAGMWQGYDGIWWTTDLGHDDTIYDWYEALPDAWSWALD